MGIRSRGVTHLLWNIPKRKEGFRVFPHWETFPTWGSSCPGNYNLPVFFFSSHSFLFSPPTLSLFFSLSLFLSLFLNQTPNTKSQQFSFFVSFSVINVLIFYACYAIFFFYLIFFSFWCVAIVLYQIYW